MKDQAQLISLLNRYLANECTLTEVEELVHYFNSDSSDFLEQLVIDEFEGLEKQQKRYPALPESVFQGIHARIAATKLEPVRRRSFPGWMAAASVVLISGIAIYFYANRTLRDNPQAAIHNDIIPGKNGATLTLANGKQILINEALAGNIAAEAGVKISKTANGQIVYEVTDKRAAMPGIQRSTLNYNTLSTARGEQTQVRLPDGTVVFLNAESSLRYPTSFAMLDKRQVTLTGEGYFEVSKQQSVNDKEQELKNIPFIVKTDKQVVEVLGTHFNINAYSDEPMVKTTLLEGSVKVTNLKSQQFHLLKPNEQASLSNDLIAVHKVAAEGIVAWKNNEFLFKDDDFRANMRKIARWYNVEIIYEADAPTNFKLGGFSSRSRNLSAILKQMEKTDKVHFNIEGKKVYVSK